MKSRRSETAARGAQAAAPSKGEVNLDTTTFSHSARDMHVTVEKPEDGYMCTLSMFARVPLSPDRLYALLIDPAECVRVFKSLRRVRQRRIISDDGAGNRVVEVDQTGVWRFLLLRGSFTVRMIVEQRAADHTITFRLARPGFMKQFSGTWHIRPYDNASLDQLVNRHNPSAIHRLQAGLRAVEHTLGLAGAQEESLVQLQQSLAPALKPPPALAKALQRIAAKQITAIMTDLQTEVVRMNGAASKAAGQQQQQTPEKQGVAEKEQPRQEPEKQRKGKKQLAAHITPLR